MFKKKPPTPPVQKRRTPEWINAATGILLVGITLIGLITTQQINFTKLQADNEIIKRDINEIKKNIYPRTEAESALNALENQFQSGDRLLEEKIRHIEEP